MTLHYHDMYHCIIANIVDMIQRQWTVWWKQHAAATAVETCQRRKVSCGFEKVAVSCTTIGMFGLLRRHDLAHDKILNNSFFGD